MQKFFLVIFFVMVVAVGLRADCGCAGCCQDSQSCAWPVSQADAVTVKALLEDDPFGEQEVDDATIVPPAPKDAIEIHQPTVSQALLQRVGCTLITGYLMCIDYLNHLWEKVSSLY